MTTPATAHPPTHRLIQPLSPCLESESQSTHWGGTNPVWPPSPLISLIPPEEAGTTGEPPHPPPLTPSPPPSPFWVQLRHHQACRQAYCNTAHLKSSLRPSLFSPFSMTSWRRVGWVACRCLCPNPADTSAATFPLCNLYSCLTRLLWQQALCCSLSESFQHTWVISNILIVGPLTQPLSTSQERVRGI